MGDGVRAGVRVQEVCHGPFFGSSAYTLVKPR